MAERKSYLHRRAEVRDADRRTVDPEERETSKRGVCGVSPRLGGKAIQGLLTVAIAMLLEVGDSLWVVCQPYL